MSLRQKSSSFLNKIFVLAQSGLGGITLLSASYSNYLIDLSDSMSFGLSVFAAIKLVQSMDDRWSRARPGFRKSKKIPVKGHLVLLGFLDDQLSATQVQNLQSQAERVVGLANVVRLDDLFGGESFITSRCAQFKALLLNVVPEQADVIKVLLANADYASVDATTYDLAQMWDTENKEFIDEVAPLVLASAARLLQ
jgi:hypothetical protein